VRQEEKMIQFTCSSYSQFLTSHPVPGFIYSAYQLWLRTRPVGLQLAP